MEKNILIFLVFSLNLNIILAQNDAKTFLLNHIKICSRNDLELNKCVKESVMQFKPFIAKGIPELNMSSCDPLLVPEVKLVQGQGAMEMSSIYKNINIQGLSDFTVNDLKIDLQNDLLEFNVSLPELYMKSDYLISGKILLLTIDGNGVFTGDYSDIQSIVRINLDKVKINENIHPYCKDVSVKMTVGNAKVDFKNLFNGKTELEKVTNDFINQNWDSVMNDIGSALEQIINQHLKRYANSFFENFTYDEIFPEF